MKSELLKAMLIVCVALTFLLQGCAVFVGGGDGWHHHHWHHWHGSLPQSDQSLTQAAENQPVAHS